MQPEASSPEFRVVLIAPADYDHAEALLEIVELLVYAIRECGFQCDASKNMLHPTAVNIVVGANLLTYSSELLGARCVILQLEQLSDSHTLIQRGYLNLLRSALGVWDFAPSNIAYLASRGIEAHLCPLGYGPTLQKCLPLSHQPIDVLFYGSVNHRRREILERVQQAGLEVRALFGSYGKQRNSCIAQAKVVLNVHYYDKNIFEAVRVSYLLNNGAAVISETSRDYPYSKVALSLVPFEQLASAVIALCKDTTGRDAYRNSCREDFKRHYYQRDLIEPLLTQLL